MTAPATAPRPAERLRALLAGPEKGNCRCPAHDDNQASLAVDTDPRTGKALVHCHAGCTTEAVLLAVGWQMADLFPADSAPSPRGNRRERGRVEVAHYDYLDERGQLLFQTVRFDQPKDFRQRRPDGRGGWIWNTRDTRLVLYRLPQVLEAVKEGVDIWVCEGEKDVHAVEAAGGVATTNPMGAGKWRPEYSRCMAGAAVLVIADADEPGRRHAAQVAVSLREHGCRVSVFEPKPGFKDIAQHLGAGIPLGMDMPFWPEERVATRALGPLLPNYWGGDDYLDQDDSVVAPWVIPGLIRANWRIVLVGGEGHGKSVITRQLAIAAAYGIHPFMLNPIPRQRTMIIDLENPDEAILETGRLIRDECRRRAPDAPRNNWHIWTEPMGLDLRKPRDQQAFAERIELLRPQLVCIGPAYQMGPLVGGDDSEVLKPIFDFLNRMRMGYGFGLVIEQHASKKPPQARTRNLDPTGSSLWLRWAEIGWKLPPLTNLDGSKATAETTEPGSLALKGYRGKRVQHSWPTEVVRGGRGYLPWMGRWPDRGALYAAEAANPDPANPDDEPF